MHRILHIGLGLYISAGWLYILHLTGHIGYPDFLIPVFLLGGLKLPDWDVNPLLEHRRTLHSLSAVFVVTAVVWVVYSRYFFPGALYMFLFPTGMVLHIIQDMATPSGCGLFHPFHSRKYRVMKLGGTSISAFAYSLVLGSIVLFAIALVYGVIP